MTAASHLEHRLVSQSGARNGQAHCCHPECDRTADQALCWPTLDDCPTAAGKVVGIFGLARSAGIRGCARLVSADETGTLRTLSAHRFVLLPGRNHVPATGDPAAEQFRQE